MNNNLRKYILFVWIFVFSGFINAQLPRGPIVNSPQVNTDRTVIFRYLAPLAKEVKLNVQFENASVPMVKDSSGVWSYKSNPVNPDIYPYFFIVDGVQVSDPLNQAIFPNEGFKSSIVEITGDVPLVHTIQNVPHGTLSYRYYFSQQLGLRPVVIYTPAGYEKDSNTNYPVLYLLHGTTDTEETWTKVGRANIILDNLIYQKNSAPMIVVMPYGRAYPVIKKSAGSLRNWDNLQEFKKDFFDNLLPFIESNYRTINNKNNRAIAGFSGGGGEALFLGLNNQNIFSWVCGFAPGMLVEEFDRNNAGAFTDPGRTNQNLKLFWIGVGREDMTYETVQKYVKVLDQKKIKHELLISEGGHTWMNCKLYLSTIVPKLFK